MSMLIDVDDLNLSKKELEEKYDLKLNDDKVVEDKPKKSKNNWEHLRRKIMQEQSAPTSEKELTTPARKKRCHKKPYPIDLLPSKNPDAKKPTYPQDAKATNMAKTNEELMIESMMQELLETIVEEPDRKKSVGRIGFTMKEKLFCLFVMAYNKCDSRKTISKLKKYHKYKQISRYPKSFKSLFNFYKDKRLSKILDDLILASALPLTHIEETGAIDATGFSTSRFDRWNHYKWVSAEGKNERKQSTESA